MVCGWKAFGRWGTYLVCGVGWVGWRLGSTTKETHRLATRKPWRGRSRGSEPGRPRLPPRTRRAPRASHRRSASHQLRAPSPTPPPPPPPPPAVRLRRWCTRRRPRSRPAAWQGGACDGRSCKRVRSEVGGRTEGADRGRVPGFDLQCLTARPRRCAQTAERSDRDASRPPPTSERRRRSECAHRKSSRAALGPRAIPTS